MTKTLEQAKPRALRKITPALRRRIEKAVSALIDALDTADAPAEDREDDADAEPDEDGEPDQDGEPSLGWCGGIHGTFALLGDDDREQEHDGAEPDEDGEPSLGSFDQMLNQTKSYRQVGDAGFYPDFEGDDADREEDDEAELDGTESEGRDYALTQDDLALREKLKHGGK